MLSRAAGLVIALSLVGGAVFAAQDVALTSLDLTKIRQGVGKPQIDKSGKGTPISIGGRTFEHGLASHAESLMWIDLKGGADRFTAFVGVDDDAGRGKGSVVFKIYGDGRLLFKSPIMKCGEAAQPVDVPLQGIKTVALIVGDADDGTASDHADWADAKFVGAAGKPVSIDTPQEKAIILTPKPSPKPRINGAMIFGVRPGHPCLYKIAATGDRPMSFSATGLPDGLALDWNTGIISGSVAKRGTYRVMLSAKNALGKATREFRIVVGDDIALTPMMGWNDFCAFRWQVTEKDIRAAADAMVSTGLADHGYCYVDIDGCWTVKVGSSDPEIGGPARDSDGNILTNKRFGDMKALADYIHSKGFKAGIYTSPGPLTCAGWAASYGHEAQDAKRFADWGYDLLKYDLCSYREVWKNNSLGEQKKPYVLMGQLLKKQDRDIVFSMCQYGMAKVWEWGEEVGGNSWRTAGDIGFGHARYTAGFKENGLEKWAGPGHWNDPDFISIGWVLGSPTRLTPNEQYSYVSLWSLLAAPMIVSSDLTKMDDFTLGLLSNDEVIEVNQDPLGKQAHRVAQRDETEVWAKDMEDGSKTIGLFNRGEFPTKVTAKWSDIGVSGKQKVRDLWRQKDLGIFSDQFATEIPRHGAALLRIWPQ